jgi:hypothetical protein
MRAKPGLKKGDAVTAGALIGLADNTGNSRGDHLHLTLKKTGATARGETVFIDARGQRMVYPRDILNPRPFLDFATEPIDSVVINKRADGLAFVSDVTIPDHTRIPANGPFIKTWLVRNNGTTDWDGAYKLAFDGNTQMSAVSVMALPAARPGDEVMVSIPMTAPSAPGLYRSTWRAQTSAGKKFGTAIYVLIRVVKP